MCSDTLVGYNFLFGFKDNCIKSCGVLERCSLEKTFLHFCFSFLRICLVKKQSQGERKRESERASERAVCEHLCEFFIPTWPRREQAKGRSQELHLSPAYRTQGLAHTQMLSRSQIKVQELGHKPAPMWIASVAGGSLSRYATMLALHLIFSQLITSCDLQNSPRSFHE